MRTVVTKRRQKARVRYDRCLLMPEEREDASITCLLFCCRGNFMFLKPSLSEVSVIYTLPFSRTVWISYALLVAILTIALVFAVRTEQRLRPSEEHRPVRWSGAALHSLGIVCQQGDWYTGALFIMSHGISRWLQAFYTTELPCGGISWNGIHCSQISFKIRRY